MTRPSRLDDPDYASFAWKRYWRLMRWMFGVTLLVTCAALTTFWWQNGMVSIHFFIATAGAIDTHVHLLSPRIMEASLAAGVTTIIGQEFGPVWGVGVNSPWALRHAFNAFDQWPVNIGFLARGSSSTDAPLIEAL